jgi:hypothetical protein
LTLMLACINPKDIKEAEDLSLGQIYLCECNCKE